jgi:hypothetical protein
MEADDAEKTQKQKLKYCCYNFRTDTDRDFSLIALGLFDNLIGTASDKFIAAIFWLANSYHFCYDPTQNF